MSNTHGKDPMVRALEEAEALEHVAETAEAYIALRDKQHLYSVYTPVHSSKEGQALNDAVKKLQAVRAQG